MDIQKEWIGYSSQKKYKKPINTWRNNQTSLTTKEMQVKTHWDSESA
jgi:hypothetical protein